MNRNITFALYESDFRNVSLTKGLILHILSRDYAYSSFIISYKNDKYTKIKFVPRIRFVFIKPNPLSYVRRLIKEKVFRTYLPMKKRSFIEEKIEKGKVDLGLIGSILQTFDELRM